LDENFYELITVGTGGSLAKTQWVKTFLASLAYLFQFHNLPCYWNTDICFSC